MKSYGVFNIDSFIEKLMVCASKFIIEIVMQSFFKTASQYQWAF